MLAQAVDLAVADLVAAGLTGPGAIAVDLAGHLLGRGAVGFGEPSDRMVAGPALGVEAGVDDEAAGAEGDRLEVAEAAERIALIDSELVAQLLGVERPAFRISVEGEQGADQRQAVAIFALPDVARNACVECEGGEAEARRSRRIVQVDVEVARHASVDRAGPGIGAGCSDLDLGRHPLHDQIAAHQSAEGPRQARADVGDRRVHEIEDLPAARVGIGEEVGRIAAERSHPLADAAPGEAAGRASEVTRPHSSTGWPGTARCWRRLLSGRKSGATTPMPESWCSRSVSPSSAAAYPSMRAR